MGGIVGALWRGEVPLARAFWDHMLLRGTLLNLTATVAALILLASGVPTAVVAAVNFAPVPWNFVLLVAVWRAAARHDGPAERRSAARLAAAIWFVVAIAL
ncbi:MAG: hypothetical protein AB7N54_10090 [Alphaproteobacteria bacterium]